jgi:hypothetical protein
MEHKIITSSSAHGLNSKIKELQEDGWEPIGGHGVVTIHAQNKYAGRQFMTTEYRIEYSQTMTKEVKPKGRQA